MLMMKVTSTVHYAYLWVKSIKLFSDCVVYHSACGAIGSLGVVEQN